MIRRLTVPCGAALMLTGCTGVPAEVEPPTPTVTVTVEAPAPSHRPVASPSAAKPKPTPKVVIPPGTWLIGEDFPAGDYKSARTVTDCSWTTYRAGTNLGDVTGFQSYDGGYVRVTLTSGEEFENSDCGDLVRQ